MNSITAINAISGINNAAGAQTLDTVGQTDAGASFKEVFESLIDKANETDAVDQQANLNLMTGDMNNLHDVIISGEEADLALRLAVQVRNKVVDAYSEIMRMQI
ncbi:MAG: flagellar hook-basal body complex protein FliE [Clostridia bacterium]|nr:flagellar hook-basal body complex protein FliE [Clostridia bacterium]